MKTPTSLQPAYVLKKRYSAYGLYRNHRLVGLDAVITITGRGIVTVEYAPATRPNEVRVSHDIPATLFSVNSNGTAPHKTARVQKKAAA